MTLFEACLCVAILSIFAFLPAPSLIRARHNYQLDLVARQVAVTPKGLV
jgi:hypothetical protein